MPWPWAVRVIRPRPKPPGRLSPDDLVEIRVHGVSNTPAHELLCVKADEVEKVAGDADTPMFRPTPGSLKWPQPRFPRELRAYSWGSLTHGRKAEGGTLTRALEDGQRAAWMVLLPFAFANVALWAQSRTMTSTQEQSSIDGWRSFLVRVFGLLLTVTFSLTTVGVVLDQLVWQWVGADDGVTSAADDDTETSAAVVRWFDFLRGDGVFGDNTRTIALGLAVVALVLLALWRVAQRTFQYEDETPTMAAAVDASSQHPMQSKHFWRGKTQVRYLSHLHIGAALSIAVVACLLPLEFGDGIDMASWRSDIVRLLLLVATALFLLSALGLALPAATHRRAPPPGVKLGSLVFFGAIAVVLGALILLFFFPESVPFSCLAGDDDARATSGMPYFDEIIVSVVAIQLIILLALWARPSGGTDNWVAWRARGPAVLASLAWVLGLLYSAVTLYWTADYLNGTGKPIGPDDSILLPLSIEIATAAFVPAVLVLGAIAAIRFYSLGRTKGPACSAQVEKAARIHDFMEARVVNWVGYVTTAVFIYCALVTYYATSVTCDSVGSERGLCALPMPSPDLAASTLDSVASFGGRLLFLLAIGLAALATQVYRHEGLSRQVGVVWDIATFWPRAGHPWAPPCYAERCVPQLATYIANRDPTRSPRFLLAGHSQGAVISLATVCQLPLEFRRRTALLTFGTQLRALYGRVFPTFFGPAALDQVAATLKGASGRAAPPDDESPVRWQSLFRLTDPLGYPVATRSKYGPAEPPERLKKVDRKPLVDPRGAWPAVDDYVNPPILGHGSYPKDQGYCDAVDWLAKTIPTRSP